MSHASLYSSKRIPHPPKTSGYFVQIKFERDDLINYGGNVQVLIFPIVKVTGIYQGNETKNEWRTRRSPYVIQTSNCVFTIPKQLAGKQKGQLIELKWLGMHNPYTSYKFWEIKKQQVILELELQRSYIVLILFSSLVQAFIFSDICLVL